MGYINERVPKEEVRTYMIPGYKEIKPFSWTIDREKDIKFFEYWTNIDDASEIYYALIWKGVVIKLILRQNVKENIVIWTWGGAIIPEESILSEEEVKLELKEILKVYGIFGYTIGERKNTSVPIFDF